MRLKQFKVSRHFGIWDDFADAWHQGDYDTAQYAAGIPCWRREKDAQAVLDSLPPYLPF